MTITLELSPEVAAKLEAQARTRGAALKCARRHSERIYQQQIPGRRARDEVTESRGRRSMVN